MANVREALRACWPVLVVLIVLDAVVIGLGVWLG
jgi:hypothetical protein